jgi:hypothetical protein
MHQFQIQANEYLQSPTRGYYHLSYVGYGNLGNPDYINDLKNTFNNEYAEKLSAAQNSLLAVLRADIPALYAQLGHTELTVCVVPRAKAEHEYHQNQLLFRSVVSHFVHGFKGTVDGTRYIQRHTNTKTTHLRKEIPNFVNDGPQPYPGITAQTCTISPQIANTHVLLIDDIYTYRVNIDEDAISALLKAGAQSVTFYAVGKTVSRVSRQ